MAFKDIFKDQLKDLNVNKTDKSNVRWLCYTAAVADFCAALSLPVTDKWTWSCPDVTPQLILFSNVFWAVAIILITDGIPLKVAFVFWETAVTMNVIGRAVVFFKNRKTLSSVENEAVADNNDEEDEIEKLRRGNEQLRAALANVNH